MVSAPVPLDCFLLFDEMKKAIEMNKRSRLDYILAQTPSAHIRKASECRKYSPLHLAAQLDRCTCAKSLLRTKADVNQLSNPIEGSTDPTFLDKSALHLAARKNHVRMTKLLLEQPGINVTTKDSDRLTPHQTAMTSGSFEVAQVLAVFLASLKASNSLCLRQTELQSDTKIFEEIFQRQLLNLTELDLSENLLTTIPAETFQLVNLTTLALNLNQIESIPSGISALTCLRYLDVNHNQIDLPPIAVLKLPNLKKFKCRKNPFCFLPPRVVSKGNVAILKYLSQIPHVEEPWKHVKLVFVGAVGSGKSTLCKKLGKIDTLNVAVSPQATHLHNQSTFLTQSSLAVQTLIRQASAPINVDYSLKLNAPGTQLYDWRLPNGISLSVWDLGSEEMHYRAFQHVMTARAIYVIVLSAPDLIDADVLPFWSQQIRRASSLGKSSIIVSATFADGPKFTDARKAQLRSLLESFVSRGVIDSFHIVSNKTNEGINVLAASIASAAIDHQVVSIQIPKRWKLLSDNCFSLCNTKSKPLILWNELISLMDHCEIRQDEREKVLELLRDSGRLTFSPPSDSANGFAFLQPNWLVTPLRLAAEFLQTQFQDGVLKLDDIPVIWNDIPEAFHGSLVSLMLSNEIFYEIKGTAYVLMPSALPEKMPETISEHWQMQVPETQRQYGRIYRFQSAAREAFSRLLIRLRHIPDTKHVLTWKGGALIKTISAESESALVTYDQVRHEVLVRCRSAERDRPELLRKIVVVVDSLIESFYSECVDVLVPCLHCLRQNQYERPFEFSKEDLVQALATGIPFVYCRNIKSVSRSVRVDVLAPDISFGDIPMIEGLIVHEQIGKGGFGAVFKGEYKRKVVAIKEVLDQQNFVALFEEFSREVYIMSSLNHPNLVKLFGISINPLRMVMEFVPGDLFHLLHSDVALSLFYRIRLALDVARGMRYLQEISPPIIHRDLRSPNILINSQDETAHVLAKVADFGLAQSVGPMVSGFLGTWQWHAPEVLDHDSLYYDEMADVYSFGIVMWEILTSGYPFEEYRLDTQYGNLVGHENGIERWEFRVQTIKKAIVYEDLRPTFTDPTNLEVPLPCQELIQICWSKDKLSRPSFPKIVNTLESIIACLCEEQWIAFNSHSRSVKRPGTEKWAPTQRVFESECSEESHQNFNIPERPTCIHSNRNNIWVGHENGLVQIYSDESQFSPFASYRIEEARVCYINAISKQVWACSERGVLYVFDRESTALLEIIENAHEGNFVRFLEPLRFPGEQFMWSCAPAEQRIRAWDPKSCSEVTSIPTGTAQFTCCRLIDDILWAGTERDINVYRVNEDLSFQLLQTLTGHTRKINQLIEPKRGEIWSCSDDGSIRVWSITTYECKHVLNIQTGAVRSMEIVRDQVWAGCFSNSVVCWSSESYHPIKELATTGPVQFIKMISGRLWIGLADKKMLIHPLSSSGDKADDEAFLLSD